MRFAPWHRLLQKKIVSTLDEIEDNRFTFKDVYHNIGMRCVINLSAFMLQ